MGPLIKIKITVPLLKENTYTYNNMIEIIQSKLFPQNY